jgi:hypothetical protein
MVGVVLLAGVEVESLVFPYFQVVIIDLTNIGSNPDLAWPEE